MRRASAFTLVELLITVTIMAMLIGLVVPIFDDATKDVRSSRRRADLMKLRTVLETYKSINGEYPDTGGTWRGDAPNFGGYGYTGATAYVPGISPNLLVVLPRDPDDKYPSGDAGYMYQSDKVDYKLVINETPDDFPADNPYRDPIRPTTAWMISTPGGAGW